MVLAVALCATPSSASERGDFEPGDLDARALEPQIVSQLRRVEGVEIDITAGLSSEGGYRGFVKPAVAVGWRVLPHVAFAPAIELGQGDTALARKDQELVLPAVVAYARGPLSLESALGYHVVDGADEWTLDTEIALTIVDGLSLLAVAKASATPDLGGASALFYGGAALAPSQALSFTAAWGQGVRDTSFDGDELIGMLAARLLL